MKLSLNVNYAISFTEYVETLGKLPKRAHGMFIMVIMC